MNAEKEEILRATKIYRLYSRHQSLKEKISMIAKTSLL